MNFEFARVALLIQLNSKSACAYTYTCTYCTCTRVHVFKFEAVLLYVYKIGLVTAHTVQTAQKGLIMMTLLARYAFDAGTVVGYGTCLVVCRDRWMNMDGLVRVNIW